MKKMVAIGVAIVLLITCTVWAFCRHRVDPQVQKLVQAQKKAFDEQLTEEQRREMLRNFRAETRKLSDSQRQQVFSQLRPLMERRANAQMDAYCRMTADQKAAYLNQRIAEMQRWQQEREARRAAEQAQGGSSPQDGGNGQNGGNAQNGNGQGGGENRFNRQANASQRRSQMLSNSTPEQRAERTTFVQDFRQQCAVQGVAPPTRGFGGGFN